MTDQRKLRMHCNFGIHQLEWGKIETERFVCHDLTCENRTPFKTHDHFSDYQNGTCVHCGITKRRFL